MTDQTRFLSGRFSLKRTLILVAVIETVLAVALFVYWTNFRDEFFPYPVNADGTVSVEGAPLLVGYGKPLTPPWVFSGVGGDTLLLNGLPFLPMREKDAAAGLQPGDRDRLLTVKAILAEAEAAYKTADAKPEGMDRFAGVLEGYLGTFVDSVSVNGETNQVTVDFVDDLPPFTVTFMQDPHWIEPEGMRRKKHFEMIEEFTIWMRGNDADAVFSFGPYHTALLAGGDVRSDYISVLAQLEALSSTPRGLPSEDDVRHELGDETYGEWEGLVQDFLSWRGIH